MSRVSGRLGDELELRAVGRAVWQRRWRILGPAVILSVLAFVIVNALTPLYRSEARILIEGRDNIYLRPEADKNADRSIIDQEAVASQVQVILSRDLALRVIRQLKLGERPEFDPVLNGVSISSTVLSLFGLGRDPLRMTPEERVLEAYYARLNVFAIDRSRVISVNFESRDPDLAARVANAVADGYLELQQFIKQEQARTAGQYLSGEIDNMRKKVAEAEAKVENFRSKSNLFTGPNSATLASQQLADINSQIAVARGQKADAETKARLIRSMLESGRHLEASEVLNSDLIRRLSEQRVTLRAQLAEQSATLLEFHPRIRELRAQIGDLENQIRAETEKVVRSLESNAKIADARVNTLNVSLAQLKNQAASSSEQDVELRALEREAKAQRDLLESYLAKYREASARDSLEAAPAEARIISRAVVSNTPSYPKKWPVVLLVGLGTLLLAAGWVATGELLGGSAVHVVEERAPRASMFQALRGLWTKRPEPEIAPRSAPPMRAAAELPVSSIDEMARTLRGAGEAGRRVTIVGAARNVGTTYTAISLGRTLAKNSRAVLVDLAINSPNISVISHDPDAPGIAELVRGEASFGEIITRDRFSRLHLVAVGHVGPDGPAILVSQRLAATIDTLARAYDHVVVDAGALPEAAIERLARLAPRAVLVATNVTNPATAAARERLIAAGFADVAMLLGQPREAAAA
ncbi:MAG TPA: exopolysaccharide transport family protein [Xanthobacteraceae bacterium]|nr:exopolysaccharide transport family protein [Xanthobacteraceae bacterium]